MIFEYLCHILFILMAKVCMICLRTSLLGIFSVLSLLMALISSVTKFSFSLLFLTIICFLVWICFSVTVILIVCQARFTPGWKSAECTRRWADLWNDLGFSLCAAPSVCRVVATSDEGEKSEWEWVLNGVSLLNTGDRVQ